MRVVIEMDCNNAAFDSDAGGDPRPEVARILQAAASRVERLNPPDYEGFRLQDINGNTVGELRIIPTAADDTDWIEVANNLERKANRSLGEGRGHFMTNFAEAVRSLGKAMYHADSRNRKRLLNWFGPYLAEASTSGRAPGLE